MLDISYDIELAAGAYTVSIQQYKNYPVSTSLADGFYYQDIQFRYFLNGFVDEMDVKRNGAWALDILNVSPSALPPAELPEPASPGLMEAALIGMLALRRHDPSAKAYS